MLGSDLLRPRPVMAGGPGLLGAAIYAAISEDQPVTRSHPNEELDVTFISRVKKNFLARSTTRFNFDD